LGEKRGVKGKKGYGKINPQPPILGARKPFFRREKNKGLKRDLSLFPKPPPGGLRKRGALPCPSRATFPQENAWEGILIEPPGLKKATEGIYFFGKAERRQRGYFFSPPAPAGESSPRGMPPKPERPSEGYDSFLRQDARLPSAPLGQQRFYFIFRGVSRGNPIFSHP